MTAELPIRNATRIPDYDYSAPGAYFVTVCCQNRKQYFDFEPAKAMVEKWWFELANKFPSIELDEFVVMPDHFHGIISILPPVGEGLCALPSRKMEIAVKPENGSTRPWGFAKLNRCSPTNTGFRELPEE